MMYHWSFDQFTLNFTFDVRNISNMSGRVWQCEMVVEKNYKHIWTPCTVTLYRYNVDQKTWWNIFFRTKQKLLLETDPFSRTNHKILLNVNQNLIVRYKHPISKDFTFHLECGHQVFWSHMFIFGFY